MIVHNVVFYNAICAGGEQRAGGRAGAEPGRPLPPAGIMANMLCLNQVFADFKSCSLRIFVID